MPDKWRCSVCGYVHVGVNPPDQCPVCGADRSRFAPVDPVEKADSGHGAQPRETNVSEEARWQCAVCGYIHTGGELPETCPVCGAEKRHFKAIDSPAPPAETAPDKKDSDAKPSTQRWQCTICGYIHTGSEPPQKCPVCGADRSKFVSLEAAADKPAGETPARSAVPEQSPPLSASTAASRLAPYRRWIDLAIENHAHPIAVHIPNGVLPVTVMMVLLAVLFDWPAIGQAGVYNMGFVFLSMPVVLFTGYLHWQFKFGGNMTDLFKWKIVCGSVVLVLSLVLFVWGLISPDSARNPGALYLLLHFVLLAVAGVAGWLGGKLVFRPKD